MQRFTLVTISTMGPVMESTLPLLISSGMQLAPMSFKSLSSANLITSFDVLAKARPAWWKRASQGYISIVTDNHGSSCLSS